MKKLIFLRDGNKSWDLLSITMATSVFDIDACIEICGYKKAVEITEKQDYDWFITRCPTILRSIDWWNEEEQKFEIYIPTEKGALKNIHEFIDKVIRHANHIENMFLGGAFDD